MSRFDELCLKAMDDLGMSPEDMGYVLSRAAIPVYPGDEEHTRFEATRCVNILLKLPYGRELYQLNHKQSTGI